MIYVIDDKVSFNTENGSLKSMENGEEVFLSSLNAGVFSCLLEHGVNPVSREDIFKAVWDEQGQSVSSATLNQYISLTRRALLAVGFGERLIITVAKTGYRINKTIAIKPLNNEIPVLDLIDPIAEESIVVSVQKDIKNHFLFVLLRILSFILPVLFLVSCFLYYKNYKENAKNLTLTYVGMVNGCPIYYSGQFIDNKSDSYLQFFSKQDLYGNRCEKDEVIIARVNFSFNRVEENGRQFIAKCLMDNNKIYHNCESEYIRAWKAN